jgi:O-antigen ligase
MLMRATQFIQTITKRDGVLAAGMALGLLLFFFAEIPFPLRLHGLLLFAVLALLRPDLAICAVPLTVPLYLIPASLTGLRSSATLLPLHEVALWLTIGVAIARWGWSLLRREPGPIALPHWRIFLLPAAFLLAGVWGAVIALPQARGEALRELRWLVVEPILFYLLLISLNPDLPGRVVWSCIIAGSVVAVFGVLQFVGLDLVSLLGSKQSFSENVVDVGAVRRVASVYGHPNNLGLFLGRVWPLAAAAVLLLQGRQRQWALVAMVLMLAGVALSFSRGAWLGALVAGLFLVWATQRQKRQLLRGPLPLIAIVLLIVVGGAALVLRGEGGSESTRTLLWREAIGYIARHPFGIGLDQFFAYHRDPTLTLIDPALRGTSEEYAAHPHNLILDIWLRLGPLGLAIFASACNQIIRGGWRQRDQPWALGAAAALAAALTHGLVDQFYFVPDLAITFWILVALCQRDRLAATLTHKPA